MAGGEERRLWPPMPWTVRLQVVAFTAAVDAAQRRDGTVNRCLFNLVDLKVCAKRRAIKGIRSTDITVDASRSLWVRVFSPTAAAGASVPVVVYFHGGGFTLLSAASCYFDRFCRRICRELAAVVVSVNYRLAPEHRFPAAPDDGVDVIHFLADGGLENRGITVDVDLSSCFVAGDSAGGNIAHHVANRWTSESTSASKSLRLAGVVLLMPFFGGEERTASELRLEGAPVVSMRRTDWSWKAYLPVGADRDHPAAHVTGEDIRDKFPAAMVVVGLYDPLQDWQLRYCDVLRRRSKAVRVSEYPNAFHGFYLFPEIEDSGKLLEEIKAFVDEQRSSPAAAGSAAGQ